MGLTMKDKRVLTKAMCKQYRKARKKVKGQILDQFVEANGYDRCYARALLRNHGRRVEVRPGVFLEGDARCPAKRPPHPRTYDSSLLVPLKKLWALTDYICGKRLKPALPGLLERLEACKELRVSKAVRAKLLAISPATIDRLLKAERARHTLKGRSHTKPGTLLKHQIPIRTFADWDDVRPGFFEMDLVGHEGGRAQGDYCVTLDLTDVDSGWTEQYAVPNKAQIHVFNALQAIRQRLPFAILGLDSDNGSEFINDHMRRFCLEEHITFTRARPNRKNDNCYIEQKNWSVVRKFVGYYRYDTKQECDLLNELYAALRDYNNFFLTSLKLKEKTRDGARVTRRYHAAQTPYQRLLDSPHVEPSVKKELKTHYNTLNPAALHRRIQALQKKLGILAARKPQHKETST